MKSAITLFALLFSLYTYSQDNRVTPDVSIMAAANVHSKTGEIVVFMIAGTEFSDLSDEDLNIKFDRIMQNTGIGIKLFIQRTKKTKASTYNFFVDGSPVGGTFGFKTLRKGIGGAVEKHKNNRL
jgi:hypothetical protein